jgi:hypothetical protein
MKLTGQDMKILGKMGHNPSLETSTSHTGWQPTERDLAAVDSMIGRGILERRPGFSSIQLTDAGQDALTDVLNEGLRDA